MSAADTLFWWTGCVVWITICGVLFIFGLPEGKVLPGVTRFTFYGFGPVLWRERPDNTVMLHRLQDFGYHFIRMRRGWLLGLSLPTWLSRKLFAKKRKAPAEQSPVVNEAAPQAPHDASAPAAAQMVCSKCGVDRFKEPCPGPHSTCPVRGEALVEG